MAHPKGVSVEGELGCLGHLSGKAGEKEDGHGVEGQLSRKQMLTDPDEAAEFVKQTGVDALAVAIGTSHGAYKFSSKPTGEVLAMEQIEMIHKRLPNTHLVMHGSSSVPQIVAGYHQQVRRQDQAHLRRAGRGDSARHQEWRAQGQRGHRLPAGDHGRDQQSLRGDSRTSSIRAITSAPRARP